MLWPACSRIMQWTRDIMKIEPRIGIELGQEWKDDKMQLVIWVRVAWDDGGRAVLCCGAGSRLNAMLAGQIDVCVGACLQAGAAGDMSREDLATYLDPLRALPNITEVRHQRLAQKLASVHGQAAPAAAATFKICACILNSFPGSDCWHAWVQSQLGTPSYYAIIENVNQLVDEIPYGSNYQVVFHMTYDQVWPSAGIEA